MTLSSIYLDLVDIGKIFLAALVYLFRLMKLQLLQVLEKFGLLFNYFHINVAFKYIDFNTTLFESLANEFNEFFVTDVSEEVFTSTSHFY